MTLPSVLFVARGLTIETFAQFRSAGILTGVIAVTALCTIFCFGVDVTGATPQLPTQPWEKPELIPATEVNRINLTPDQVRAEGVDVPTGEIRLLFGAIHIPLRRTPEKAVGLVHVFLGGLVADSLGLLLALLWTASFLPGFVSPTSASVLFTKPIPRWTMLLGKAGTILLFVGLQALAFLAITFVALGIRTGVWDLHYFLAAPVLIIHFVTFFSIAAVIAVFFRSTVACVVGTLAAWLVCCGINFVRHEATQGPDRASAALECSYWILPKPMDYSLILSDALGASSDVRPVIDVDRLSASADFRPELSVATGLVFAAVLFAVAGGSLARTDY